MEETTGALNMTGWVTVLKVEQYDPCCEGARTSIVSLVDEVMRRWPPGDSLPDDIPEDIQDLVKEIDDHMKEFRAFLLKINCNDIRELIQRKGEPKIFADDGDIALFWIKHMKYLHDALAQCDGMKNYADKLEFNTDLFEGREDWA